MTSGRARPTEWTIHSVNLSLSWTAVSSSTVIATLMDRGSVQKTELSIGVVAPQTEVNAPGIDITRAMANKSVMDNNTQEMI